MKVALLAVMLATCVALCFTHPHNEEKATKNEFIAALRAKAMEELSDNQIKSIVSALLNQKEELARSAAVNPANFRCTKSSPTDQPVWSNTQPAVALTHIFCGQISRGKAEGYHSRPGNRDPVCARVNNKIQFGTHPLNCYRKIEVRQYINGLRDKWIARDPGTYCFFPSQWNIPYTVNVLTNIYNGCQNPRSRDADKICYRNYNDATTGQNFGVVIFIKNDPNGNEVINSAFPVPGSMYGTMPCRRYCN